MNIYQYIVVNINLLNSTLCIPPKNKMSTSSFPILILKYTLFYKQQFFSTQCCLTFKWIELQMLLWCCLIHIIIIILRHILYLVNLCPYLGLGLFMSYLCHLFSIFSLILIVVNHITSFKQTHLLFVHF